MSNPIIVINVNMASKGHQIGRLVSSCDNVSWYDHSGNGEHPWMPCSNILNADLSKFHYDRRFADNSTIPPVLDFARRSGLPLRPTINYDNRLLTYITHGELDESRDYFDGNHLVVLNLDVERFMSTSWDFKVGKTKTPISELYTELEVVNMLYSNLFNYKEHMTEDDFVIESVDDLLDMDTFKKLCSKFGLQFNEQNYVKVRNFITQ